MSEADHGAAVDEDAYHRVGQLERVIGLQTQRLAGMLRISASLGRSRDPQKAMCSMVVEISKLLGADRTTIYQLQPELRVLTGLAVQGEQSVEVVVPLGVGIAGVVAERGRSINLKDAYLHEAFDPAFDKRTGYRTRSMLCVPMHNPKRQIIGVVQVLNKADGYFTVHDEQLLGALAAQAAITLEALHLQLALNVSNSELRGLSDDLEQKVKELELLYANEQAGAKAANPEAMASEVLGPIAAIARCDAAALLLLRDDGFGPLYLGRADSPLEIISRVEIGEGVLGKTASRQLGYVLDADRFEATAIPQVLCPGADFVLRDAVTAPLMDEDRVIGAFALLNRRELDRRDDEEDQRMATLLGAQLGRAALRIEARKSAQQRDRMMTIGQMLSGVLHDLKGPMTVISGYSQLMADVDDPAERAEMAQSIRSKINQFNDMTREVMAFARGDRTVFSRKVYLHKFVSSMTESLQPEYAERGVAFEVIDRSKGVGFFDEPKMARVVTNIARNARQAMDAGGSFRWTIRDGEDAGGLVFELADTGPGIPAHIRDEVFEAFTTSGKAGGTGLGLAIVRRIVEDHGGLIELHTETGVGTKFTITLPGSPGS